MGARALDKLAPILQGPMKVIAQTADKPNEYIVGDIANGRTFRVHVGRLRYFYFDPLKVRPDEVARRDRGEFLVEKIVGHVGNPTKPGTMRFKVRWLGYTEQDDSWLPWKELKNNYCLHHYLQSVRLGDLVPPVFRETVLRDLVEQQADQQAAQQRLDADTSDPTKRARNLRKKLHPQVTRP
jgi:hypothetical protein